MLDAEHREPAPTPTRRATATPISSPSPRASALDGRRRVPRAQRHLHLLLRAEHRRGLLGVRPARAGAADLPAARRRLCAIGSFACVWLVQALALGTHDWFSVSTTQLAGNAFNRITPGGGATGTALQANMLATPASTSRTRRRHSRCSRCWAPLSHRRAAPVRDAVHRLRGRRCHPGCSRRSGSASPCSCSWSASASRCFVADAPLRGLGRAVTWVRRKLHRDRSTARSATGCSRVATAIRREVGPHWQLALGASLRALAVRVRRAPVDAVRPLCRTRSRAGRCSRSSSRRCRADPVHTRRARVRRGRPGGDARSRGDLHRRRVGGDARVPPAHVLAADPARRDRGAAVPQTPPAPLGRDACRGADRLRGPTSSRRAGGRWWPTSRGRRGGSC